MAKQKHEPETTNPFEAIIRDLRPFIKGYAQADSHRVKIWIQGASDTPELEAVIAASDGRIQRNHGTLFVDYGDLSAVEAIEIMVQVMGDSPDSIA